LDAPPPSDAKSYQSAGSSNAPLPGSVVFEARDFERYARTVAAFIRLAMIRIMLKLLVASPLS
jgi:hypothetical protein